MTIPNPQPGDDDIVAEPARPHELEFRTWYLRGVQAWNERDVEFLTGPDGGGTNSPGVGYRVSAARTHPPADREQALRGFFASMIRFRVEEMAFDVVVDDDIYIATGHFTEDFEQRDHDPERVRIRFSEVFRRHDDGWQAVWYHRDIQDFDDGRYDRRPGHAATSTPATAPEP